MLGFITALGNRVNIKVKYFKAHELKRFQSGFLKRLSSRYPGCVAIAISVPAQLQPPIEFFMMGKQTMLVRAINNPCRASNVPYLQAPGEAAFMGEHKLFELLPYCLLLGVALEISIDRFDQFWARHGQLARLGPEAVFSSNKSTRRSVIASPNCSASVMVTAC